MNLNFLTLKQSRDGIREKKIKPSELTEVFLQKIEKTNPSLSAFLTVTAEKARAQASEADKRAEKQEFLSELDGVPCAVKDIINTANVRTTCASKMLQNFVPPYNATVIEKLDRAGFVMLGKTNTDEFACGGSTEFSAFGTTKNPWDITRVAGGSSGGSACASAAGLCCYSLGTDTGGSIRQPASFCGVSGLKVSYGRVSRSGVTAMASSLDTVGGFARTVYDLSMMLSVIAGYDKKDSTTGNVPVPNYESLLKMDIKGVKIGVPKEYFADGLDSEVAKVTQDAIKQYEKMGAIVSEVSLPYTKYAVAVYYIIMPAELSANLARFDGIRFGLKPSGEIKDLTDQYYKTRDEGFGDEVKRRILTGTYVLSAGYFDAYYKKALKVRTLIIKDFEDAFKKVDFLLAPVAPSVAWKMGQKSGDPLSMYLEDAFTIPSSVAGLSSLSIPAGFSSDGMPIGLQIIAPQYFEQSLLAFGHQFQENTDWHLKVPQGF